MSFLTWSQTGRRKISPLRSAAAILGNVLHPLGELAQMRLVVAGKRAAEQSRIMRCDISQLVRGRSIRVLLAYAKTILAHDFKTQSRQGS